jgi:hypothetical protein
MLRALHHMLVSSIEILTPGAYRSQKQNVSAVPVHPVSEQGAELLTAAHSRVTGFNLHRPTCRGVHERREAEPSFAHIRWRGEVNVCASVQEGDRHIVGAYSNTGPLLSSS